MSGCANAPPPRAIEAPPALFECPAPPEVPGAGADQRAAAVYLLELAAAHEACRARLAAVARLVADGTAGR